MEYSRARGEGKISRFSSDTAPLETDHEAVAARKGSIIALDACGTIQRCDADAAALFFAEPAAFAGQHIKRLIPDLPLKSSTPGFNVAYATFCAANPLWARYRCVDAVGSIIRLYVSFDAPKLDRPQQIILRVHDFIEQAGDVNDWIAAGAAGSAPTIEHSESFLVASRNGS